MNFDFIQIWLEKNHQILNNKFRCQNKAWVDVLSSINIFFWSSWSYLIYSNNLLSKVIGQNQIITFYFNENVIKSSRSDQQQK